jgi:hypothetical protein
VAEQKKLTREQLDLLGYLASTPYQEWFYTRRPSPTLGLLESIPTELISRHLSSIGEDSEKVHVAITNAGRAIVETEKRAVRRG